MRLEQLCRSSHHSLRENLKVAMVLKTHINKFHGKSIHLPNFFPDVSHSTILILISIPLED